MKNQIRVLVVDDSSTLRRALTQMLSEDPALLVVGEANDGVAAVRMAIELRPDVITMDVDMPGLDGLAATAAIMAEAPSRVLIVCALGEARQMDLSFRAISAGALELISKPAGGDHLHKWGRQVAEAVRLMADVPVVRRRRTPGAGALSAGAAGTVDVFGLVASTGGPPALVTVLGGLPKTLRIPLLVVQHLAEGFTPGLVRWCSQTLSLPVELASDAAPCRPGHVYLPPDGHDLELDPQGLLRTPRSTGVHRPSGNRMLHSLARSCGARAGGIVLTGMGDDGAQGLLAIRNAGGLTFAQDEATSVVFGMPAVAVACGATSTPLPPEALTAVILRHGGTVRDLE
jgi:two-component system chemotaxis response regulator CheB